MSDGRLARKITTGFVIGNLIVLSTVFLAPRIEFLMAHTGLTSNQLMETKGSSDMPNQLAPTYAVVNRIRELTPVSAIIFMPPGDRMQGSFRSATIQILYPRKIFFGEDGNFQGELKKAEKSEGSYFVYSPQWNPEYCPEASRMGLTDFGFGMCRLTQKN